MADVPIQKENIDIYSYDRDRCRTPMQWDGTTNAGFSTSENTWLPLASNYDRVNVELQKSKKHSHLNVFQKLGELRKRPTMKYGAIKINEDDDYVLAYKRYIDGEADVIVIILNFSNYDQLVNAHKMLNGLPDKMQIFVSSVHFENE